MKSVIKEIKNNLCTELKKRGRDPHDVSTNELCLLAHEKKIHKYFVDFFIDFEKVCLKHNIIFSLGNMYFIDEKLSTEDGEIIIASDEVIKSFFKMLKKFKEFQ